MSDLPTGLPTATCARTPTTWTAEHVGGRLVAAFRTLDRLPRVAGPRQTGNHWPQYRLEWADHVARAELPEPERRARDDWRNDEAFRPSGREIAQMDQALDWLRTLRDADPALARLAMLWALRAARGRSIRALCREKGWLPATFYKLRARALGRIAADLEAAGIALT